MITEAHRRALFALREALHLCESAEVLVWVDDGGLHIQNGDSDLFGRRNMSHVSADFIDEILAEHPEQ